MPKTPLLFGLILSIQTQAQVLDVDGDKEVGPHEALAVAEQWKGPASASDEHDHLGQTWVGNGNPLEIKGDFGFSLAPLVLGNDTGPGVRIEKSEIGLVIVSASGAGMNIGSVGTVSSGGSLGGNNGINLSGVEDYGIVVGSAGKDGLRVVTAGEDGVHATTVGPSHYGGYFRHNNLNEGGTGLYARGGNNDSADILLGGRNDSDSDDDGRIAATEYSSSDFVVTSNDSVVIRLDENQTSLKDTDAKGLIIPQPHNEDSSFRVVNGGNNTVFIVDENGDATLDGGLTQNAGKIQLDHPLDPENKTLVHSNVASPEMKTVYDGVAVLDGAGKATVLLPDYFESLNESFRYALTALDAPAPSLHVAERIKENRFKIAGGRPNQEISWMVTGVRKDAYAKSNPIRVEQKKAEE